MAASVFGWILKELFLTAEKMKGVVLRQLQQATGVASPGLVNRLLASGADSRPVALFTNHGGARGMATGAEIMCGPSKNESPKQENKGNAAAAAAAEPGVSSAVSAAALEEAATVVAMPAASSAKQKWWRPDPATGTWVPEGGEGQVTTSTDAMKSPSRVTRIRSDTTASLEDKRWWTSMEELPDMDRANPK